MYRDFRYGVEIMNKPYDYYEHPLLSSFSELLSLNYKKNPDKIAFTYKIDKEVINKSYKDFYKDVTNLTNYLTKEYNNEHIAIISENSYNYIVLFFSIIISNNIAVLIDKDLDEESIKKLLKQSDTKVLYYSKNHCDLERIIKKYKSYEIDNVLDIPKLNKKETKKKCKESVLFFTSGTTGANKCVMLSEENILSDIYGACSIFKPNGDVFACLPFHHAFGLITSILKPFFYNETIFINNSLKTILTDLKISKPNTMFVVPTFIETFYKQIWKNAKKNKKTHLLKSMVKTSNMLLKIGIDLRNQLFKSIHNSFGGNIEYIICGGAYLDPKYIIFFRSIGINILNGYGITECSPVVAVNRNHYYRDGSVGQIVKGAEIKIKENEILVKGKMVMLGFYKDKKATDEVLKDGYFHTGDFGYIDKDGFLFITGRKKNLIILSNGENISPELIEEELSHDEAVSEIIVYENNNKLLAEIYPREEYLGNKSYFDDLIYKYNSKVPKNHQIALVTLRNNEFPKNNNKKILRNKFMEEKYGKGNN